MLLIYALNDILLSVLKYTAQNWCSQIVENNNITNIIITLTFIANQITFIKYVTTIKLDM